MAASGQEGTSAALAQKARETWRTLGVLCTQPFTPTQKSEQPLTGHPQAWKPDLREMIPTQEKPLGLASLLSPDVTCPLNPLSFTSEVDTLFTPPTLTATSSPFQAGLSAGTYPHHLTLLSGVVPHWLHALGRFHMGPTLWTVLLSQPPRCPTHGSR